MDPSTCAYPRDTAGEHNHDDCLDTLEQLRVDALMAQGATAYEAVVAVEREAGRL